MAFPTTLAACSLTPASNGPAGTDLPSDLDDAIRQVFALVAQLRDGAGTPVGSIVQLPTVNTPTGYLKMNGQIVSRTTYPALWTFAAGSGCITSDAIWGGGTWFGQFSTGDGSTNFRLPDLRGAFTRGLDESRGLDPGRGLGAFQEHAILSHTHGINDPTHSHTIYDVGHSHAASTDVQGLHNHTYQAAVNTVFTAGGAAPVSQAQPGTATSSDGSHAHNVTINAQVTGVLTYGAGTGVSVAANGGAQNTVRNIAYPFFIKY